MPSMRPAMASSTARWMNWKAASPAIADKRPKGRSSGTTARSMQSTWPIRYGASAGSPTVCTRSFEPTMPPALRSLLASPITSGRLISYTSGTARAFMMISGPMPAASPMVMAMIGRAMSPAPGARLERGACFLSGG